MTQAADSKLQEICDRCPQLDPASVRAAVARFDEEYLRQFDADTIARHVQAMLSLSQDRVAVVLVEPGDDGSAGCTIIAFDHPFEFSSITGMMAATGFSIESCDAFTLREIAEPSRRSAAPKRAGQPRSQQLGRRSVSIHRRDPLKDSLILDHFRGRVSEPQDARGWAAEFEPAILEVIKLLDQQEDEATERAKRLVNERVTQRLKARLSESAAPAVSLLRPADVTIQRVGRATRLRMRAPDAPAFLYALSTALSLHGLQIEKTRVRTIDAQAVDEIDLVDRSGRPLDDAQREQQLRVSVLLTQQFAYFLDRSPDPFTALRRFEELSEKIVQTPQQDQWLALLSHPLSMTDLAKVLGASDYLWEDFIKLNADALLPIFRRHLQGREVSPPARSLPRRLEESMQGAANFDEQRQRLNQFKDRELFLIDLDHILSNENPDFRFQILSERLVLLAESLVAVASKVVYEELTRLYGPPRGADGSDCHYAIFGLGKLGGVALGYASDIELLFVFESEGRTAGGTRGSLPNDEFHAIFTRETCDYIHAKREGIFEVDLRLRPYGKGGPLATSVQQFSEYYSPSGKAHPFERMALVRLRWIAGDPKLGFDLERLRDQIVYDGPAPDVNELWQITAKMRQQHAPGKELNSKYSAGALADLETAVQLLQVLHAKDAPQLRTPRITDALAGLRRARVLSAIEFEQVMGAYQFFRRLINAQRVLRGSAQDLFLPAPKSDELIHLARRMNYLPEADAGDIGAMLLQDFDRQTQAVQQFIRSRFRR